MAPRDGPVAIVVSTHISTQATNSRRSISPASWAAAAIDTKKIGVKAA